jgi:trans-2,3-dihydro-3-hydroxyanthranilate isomerase
MRLRYRLVNVFARQGDPFSGNPLCVFEDGSGLSDEQMQGLARQFNLSETTFIQPPATGADLGVRIFTASHEMAFAGHPTLGTAHIARLLGRGGDAVRLSMPAGVIPVVADGNRWTLTARPGEVLDEYDPSALAAAVGLEAGEVVGPVELVTTGSPQVVARVGSSQALNRAYADARLMSRFPGMAAHGGETLVYLWHEPDDHDGSIEARALFTEGANAGEDPATGSACANLGVWLAARGRSGTWTVSQGLRVDRPSTLELSVGGDGSVQVGGLVHDVGGGEVAI